MGLIPVLVLAKRGSLHKAAEKIEEISWTRNDWVPPKIQVATFRKTGKMAELDDFEAALLLELPIKKILALLLYSMNENGMIRIISTSPLRLEIGDRPLSPPRSLYEKTILNAIRSDHTLDPDIIKGTIIEAVDNIQRKSWDCDLAAMRK
jgi:hypothetical protein